MKALQECRWNKKRWRVLLTVPTNEAEQLREQLTESPPPTFEKWAEATVDLLIRRAAALLAFVE